MVSEALTSCVVTAGGSNVDGSPYVSVLRGISRSRPSGIGGHLYHSRGRLAINTELVRRPAEILGRIAGGC